MDSIKTLKELFRQIKQADTDEALLLVIKGLITEVAQLRAEVEQLRLRN